MWQVSKLLVFTTAEMLESVCGEAVHWYTPLTTHRAFRSGSDAF